MILSLFLYSQTPHKNWPSPRKCSGSGHYIFVFNFGPSWAAGPGIFGGSCILGLGLVKVRLKVRFKVSIGGRVRVSFFRFI